APPVCRAVCRGRFGRDAPALSRLLRYPRRADAKAPPARSAKAGPPAGPTRTAPTSLSLLGFAVWLVRVAPRAVLPQLAPLALGLAVLRGDVVPLLPHGATQRHPRSHVALGHTVSTLCRPPVFHPTRPPPATDTPSPSRRAPRGGGRPARADRMV